MMLSKRACDKAIRFPQPLPEMFTGYLHHMLPRLTIEVQLIRKTRVIKPEFSLAETGMIPRLYHSRCSFADKAQQYQVVRMIVRAFARSHHVLSTAIYL
ncbi:hypothetical protein GCM10022405_01110 [Gibbsiella dentisursi]|uniref:Transposase n=1 Tax=Gibbsiella dentisursi TaxID=796890 RepID=A0ABP7KLI6_9GAMM